MSNKENTVGIIGSPVSGISMDFNQAFNRHVGEKYLDLHSTDMVDKDAFDEGWGYKVGKGWGFRTPHITKPKIGRNDSCSCGSGKKYKNCCLTK